MKINLFLLIENTRIRIMLHYFRITSERNSTDLNKTRSKMLALPKAFDLKFQLSICRLSSARNCFFAVKLVASLCHSPLGRLHLRPRPRPHSFSRGTFPCPPKRNEYTRPRDGSDLPSAIPSERS